LLLEMITRTFVEREKALVRDQTLHDRQQALWRRLRLLPHLENVEGLADDHLPDSANAPGDVVSIVVSKRMFSVS